MFEGPPTGELEDFTAALAPSAYFFAGDFREVTDRFVKGPPGGAVLPPRQTVGSAIFLIHGANVGRREEVVRVLEQLLGEEIDVVVLHEQPHRGRTLIEKFEETAAAAKYAVALLTRPPSRSPRAKRDSVLAKTWSSSWVLFFGNLGAAGSVSSTKTVSRCLPTSAVLPSSLGRGRGMEGNARPGAARCRA